MQIDPTTYPSLHSRAEGVHGRGSREQRVRTHGDESLIAAGLSGAGSGTNSGCEEPGHGFFFFSFFCGREKEGWKDSRFFMTRDRDLG